MKILNAAYPFAPAGPDAVGGAEQVLAQVDRALCAAGHSSFVLGCEGSRACGHLSVAFGIPDAITDSWKERAYAAYREHLERIIDEHAINLVHFHGVDFWQYLPRRDVPLLATLHLPPDWYAAPAFASPAWLHCVSGAQDALCPRTDRLLPPIANGVSCPAMRPVKKRGYAISLGRVCPEKGFHLAVEASRRADVSFLLAGEVFPYETHVRYFEDEIVPRMDERRRFIGRIGGRRKLRYMAAAQCLLVPSLVAETSSLVTMEALACGTPVIAFARGALTSLIDHGRTGFLVESLEEMARAIPETRKLDPEQCREVARERFSLEEMTRRYLARYEEILRCSSCVEFART